VQVSNTENYANMW